MNNSVHTNSLDAASRRVHTTRKNGQRWDYGYDPLGQVTSAVKKFPDSAAIPGHTFSYQFDGIGNRTSAVQGGTGTAVTYPTNQTNALNQYTSIVTEGGRFILGEAPAANEVTVNGSVASRAGGLGFYWKQITGDNSSGPLWSSDTVASNGITISGNTWTPKETVTPVHDFDGNLTSDGRWDYSWDAENRLTRMETTIAAANAGVPRQRMDFVYDSQGRRVCKTVSTSTDGTIWTFASNQRFLYDGWNLVAEYSAPSESSTTLTLQASHTWGIDLSGTMQGAGGVGGLLCTTLTSQPSALNCYPAFDGNGNISAWIDSSGSLLARMDYSPFGQLIAQYKFTGDATLSRLNFGFSTKYTDAETGMLYYGHRYYDSVVGRWPSRDPIEEEGGINLYGFVGNDGVNQHDLLGMIIKEADHSGIGPRRASTAGNERFVNFVKNKYKDKKICIELYRPQQGSLAHSSDQILQAAKKHANDEKYKKVVLLSSTHGSVPSVSSGQIISGCTVNHLHHKSHFANGGINTNQLRNDVEAAGGGKTAFSPFSCWSTPHFKNKNGWTFISYIRYQNSNPSDQRLWDTSEVWYKEEVTSSQSNDWELFTERQLRRFEDMSASVAIYLFNGPY